MFHFGVVHFLPVNVGTICLLIVLIVVISFEKLTNLLESYKKSDPAVYTIIQRVYKELTILGFIVFMLELYEANKPRNMDESDYRAAVDYVHVLLFFMALFFVLHSIIFVAASIIFSKEYEEFHITPLSKILSDINNLSPFGRNLYDCDILPGSQVREIVEFKMLHILFKRTYQFDDQFNFALFLKKSFQEQVLELLELRLHSWVGLFVVAILNLIRVKITQAIGYYCANPRHEHEELIYCSDYDASVFVIGGLFVSALATFLCILSRIYEIRLIHMIDSDSGNSRSHTIDYESILLRESLKPKNKLRYSFSVADIKASVVANTNKFTREIATQVSKSHIMTSVPTLNNHTASPSSVRKSLTSSEQVTAPHLYSPSGAVEPFDQTDIRATSARSLNSSPHSSDGFLNVRAKEQGSNLARNQLLQDPPSTQKFRGSFHTTKASLDLCQMSGKTKLDIDRLFLLGRRFLFFRAVEMLVMLNCLYMGVWATDFASAFELYNWWWQIILLLPFLYNLLCLGAILKTSSKMNALHKLNSNIIGEMHDDEKENLKVIEDLRSTILERIIDIGLDSEARHQTVRDLFQQLDANNDGVVSRKEMQVFLGAMHIHLSDSKLERLFQFLDTDNSGSLNVGEVSELIFPSDEGKEVEREEDEGESSGFADVDHLNGVVLQEEDDVQGETRNSNFSFDTDSADIPPKLLYIQQDTVSKDLDNEIKTL